MAIRRAAITGLGLITANGNTLAANWAAGLAGKLAYDRVFDADVDYCGRISES
jgi:hypothetical protein